MNKYIPKHAPDDSDDADHEWYVEYEDGQHLVELNGLREAEAKIIAFALNAVADGGRLQVAHLCWPEPTIIPYIGPTLPR